MINLFWMILFDGKYRLNINVDGQDNITGEIFNF